ncbi:hypothetical protein WKR88_12350 [Trinickia caryophylli]|uniref:Uncharacterized protein n=1 Tax=Trinickia caryophylli TaxID=28094 RepID=A0A1X7H9U7_TRICW|nr:hypothetical protein [Trinickia caryophylli]PMS08956.1 hypothetical protein C0Z17_27425 [Trinickia caryophylli]TRX17507.1 hypothetical protein FNF07_04175 [Trinickia caryophylli]WQE11745.1 hypothetical protein U0034_18730 [Trinickia caryophylli]SMF82415.1 hypothetical protein SAMN06295900_1264 [Trinickia caryophylli]GLU35820.1 hypothetical protein Busp01_56620 [Trinickia caryophylli]
MQWDTTRYPVSMRNMEPWIRDKAIEIANALLREGVAEDSAIRIAIAQAKRWAARSIRRDRCDEALAPMKRPSRVRGDAHSRKAPFGANS